MKGLLVRVAADTTEVGGGWNGPVDSKTGEFVYVPIRDSGPFHPGPFHPFHFLFQYYLYSCPQV